MIRIVDIERCFEAACMRTTCPERGNIFRAGGVEYDFFLWRGQIRLTTFSDNPVKFDVACAINSDFCCEDCPVSTDIVGIHIFDTRDSKERIDDFNLYVEFGKEHVGIITDLPVTDVVTGCCGGYEIDREVDGVAWGDTAH